MRMESKSNVVSSRTIADIAAPETADGVNARSDANGLTPETGVCVLGGGMYAGNERYWTAISNATDRPIWITGSPLAKAEIAWAHFSVEAC